ncbi:hypothetical protein NX801_12590 [Streptomyces sp. LP05-1]|uniref:PH domain-containing protein n=1 Tax=Streptomyces pyxinae TaxID=2970734 RepID=A0ABT2CGF4_9ACTN|nr:hypothetical protein [Streptomyces sp. LP05-1]MCS0636485.1 hypothetical protein [Streptomyces sp. LP05-1]
MPLSFLTADRAADETPTTAGLTGDSALPFDDHDAWRRPYRPGPWRVGAAALALLPAAFLLLAAVGLVLTGALTAAAVSLGAALLVIAAALRLLRMGVWVSRHGVRRVGFLVARTVPWARVASMRTTQQPVRLLGLPRTVQGQALVLTERGERAQPDGGRKLVLLTDRNADFLSRVEAFDRAADTVEAWGEEYAVRG